MSKYNFGYEIIKGSTMEWAFQVIEENTTVLELGAAVGTLTKNLFEKKHCSVDIVEIDREAGEMAKCYARKSFIGEIQGNIDGEEWKKKIGDKKQYDYVVILDVLEHLKDPEGALKYVRKVLKDDGELILSVPNIAHNSILINLFNNKFNYTDVGLLDDTHVKFFTESSLDELMNKCHFYIKKREYKQILVGENEIKNSYKDVPEEVAFYFRMRPYGDVYQFLLRAGTEKCEDMPRKRIPSALPFTKYPLEVYNDSNELKEVRHIDPVNVRERIKLSKVGIKFRIDPFDEPCIIKDFSCAYVLDGKRKKARTYLDNGICMGNHAKIYLDNDPQIYLEAEEGTEEIEISYKVTAVSLEIAQYILKMITSFNQTIGELNEVIHNQNELISEKNQLLEEQEQKNIKIIEICQKNIKSDLNK